MKRTTKVIALLLVLATALILAGCEKEPAIPPAEKGEWVKASTGSFQRNPSRDEFWEQDQETYRFLMDTSEFTLADSCLNSVANGTYIAYGFAIGIDRTGPEYIGCEMNTTVTSGSVGQVCIYFNRSQAGSYELRLTPGAYKLYKYVSKNGTHTGSVVKSETNAAIKGIGQTNKVKITTKDNGNIYIYVNDTLIHTIAKPEYTAGEVVIEVTIYESDVETGADPVEITFADIKLQKDSE